MPQAGGTFPDVKLRRRSGDHSALFEIGARSLLRTKPVYARETNCRKPSSTPLQFFLCGNTPPRRLLVTALKKGRALKQWGNLGGHEQTEDTTQRTHQEHGTRHEHTKDATQRTHHGQGTSTRDFSFLCVWWNSPFQTLAQTLFSPLCCRRALLLLFVCSLPG